MNKRLKQIFTAVLSASIFLGIAACEDEGWKRVKTYEPEKVYSYTFDLLGEDVMPIGGYMAPTSGYAYGGVWYESKITDEQFALAEDAGINLLYNTREDYNIVPDTVKEALGYAETHKIVYLFPDTGIVNIRGGRVADADTMAARIPEYADSPSFGGLTCIDEPGKNYFDLIRQANENFSRALGEKKGTLYVNLFPSYAGRGQLSGNENDQSVDYNSYISSYIETCSPEYLSYDYYPFIGTTESTQYNVESTYFSNLNTVRSAAENNGIPFWVYIQAGGMWEGRTDVRIPNEGEVLWQVNTGLACGAKGIQYFPYVLPPEWSDMDSQAGLINKFGQKNAMYFYAQKANRQIQAIDHVLMNAHSAGVIAHGNTPASFYGEMKIDSYRQLKGVSGDDALVGCFDYQGRSAFYVVSNSITAEKAEITLKFDQKYCFDVTQRAQERSTVGKELTLKLAAGEGALVLPR